MKPLQPDQSYPIGHYRPLVLLGEGAMGQVFLCLSQDGRVAAVKRIHPSFSKDDGFRVRFRQEVEASRRVSGAYTAAVMDADPEAEAPWLASVYVAGPSLRDAIDANGPLPVPSMRRLIAGLATALSDVHRAGLIHRDLKPGNVLLTSDGPRVIDFGIARAAEGAEFTSTGTVVGSPAYMSPEQAEGKDLTPASDMFSLGALLVMAATGQGPFTGTTAAQTLYNVVHEPPQLDGVPPEILPVIEACLAHEPEARPTPAQLLDLVGPIDHEGPVWPAEIQQLIDTQEAEVRHVLALPPPEPPPPPRKPRWPKVTALIGAGAAVVALAVTQGMAPVAGTVIEPEQREPVAQALSVDRLRDVDACALLKDETFGDTTLQPSSYSMYLHRCRYGEGGFSSGRVNLEIGATIDRSRMSATGDRVAGQSVLQEGTSSGCTRAVALPSSPQQAITIDVSEDSGLCEYLTEALDVAVDKLRTEPPKQGLPENSLARTDICALVDDDAARRELGVVQSKTADDLSTCRIDAINGNGSLRADLAYSETFGPNNSYRDVEEVQLDGVTGYQSKRSSSCAIEWKHRDFEGGKTEKVMPTIETVGVTYTPHNDNAKPCEKAKGIANAVLKNLPPAS
ncbi:serine/threonine-protein kinase [Prauserella alba]|uniref:Protein kinase domain-containing protein n=1 Tax=Prauserella alba TaxID=176898 RepID=A0ABN1V7B1_9PSEU|nr:serine/threonine-protein kinase [Prauserella alba]MCP2181265.1 Serine/threonine protein kinase [Prauserella alba]